MNALSLRKTLMAVTVMVAMSLPVITCAAAQIDELGNEVVRVSYGDLDLSKDTGVKVLYSRIRHAADQACGGRVNLQEAGSVEKIKAYQECVDNVATKLVTKANNADLSGLHTS